MSEGIVSIKKCPECNGTELMHDYEQGEIVCVKCGYVVYDRMRDVGPEWRAFDDEQRAKRTRVGAPLTYAIHDKGLSTMISWHDQDVYGKELSVEQKAQIHRLRKWQRRTRIFDGLERNLAVALSEMSRLASTLSLPKSILETASYIYRRAVKKRLARGRSILGMAAASLYLACRETGVTRTLQEITMATDLTKKDVARSYRFLVNQLGSRTRPPSAMSHASRFANILGLAGRVEAIAQRALKVAQSMLLTSGRGPMGIAAAATYMASVLVNDKKTQRDIAHVAGVTEVTIRNRYKELLRKLDIVVPL